MSKTISRVIESPSQTASALQWADQMISRGLEGGPVKVTLGRHEDQRTNQMNRLMWALLTDLSEQVVWHGIKLSPEEWKDLTTASLKHQKAVPGMDGGFVMVGGRTSKMTKREHSDLIECLYAFGGEQGVQWSDPALKQ
ncbi:NinB protein [Kushneria sinocarnis]|uniref:NinB protein n=1 Tax=Kushneria sinocarnis TaxID=595502 RepID=A0A420WUK2_9GAMM|nr:recombination protein NinB [Kushneria sinocarnis]RKQ97127.1 NinB protein [Kushneria sinocarnis]